MHLWRNANHILERDWDRTLEIRVPNCVKKSTETKRFLSDLMIS